MNKMAAPKTAINPYDAEEKFGYSSCILWLASVHVTSPNTIRKAKWSLIVIPFTLAILTLIDLLASL